MYSKIKFLLNDDGNSYTVAGVLDETVRRLEIPEKYEGKPVTAIGAEAFSGPHMKFPCEFLEEVIIPASVEVIGRTAFACCAKMHTFIFKDESRLRTISEQAFYSCLSLSRIRIPDGVSAIHYSAFYNCQRLTNLTLPKNLSLLDEYFDNCHSLKLNTYDNGQYLGTVDNPYFALVRGTDKNITSCLLHEDCKFIIPAALWNHKKLETVVLPEGLIGIGQSAFRNCESLMAVTLPSGIKTLPGYAFAGCESLEKVLLPEGLTAIGSHAFTDCKSLRSLSLPDGVTSIGEWAFNGCESLAECAIPEGVTVIGLGAFSSTALT